MTPASRDRAILALVVGLAIATRLPLLVRGGLWRDQANVYIQELSPTFGEFAHRLTSTEYHPPLYFAIAFGFKALFGTSELVYLVLPFLFSVATAAVVYHLGASLGYRRIGIFAAILYAVSPLVVEESTDYLYPQMAFFSTLLSYVVLRWKRERIDRRRWALVAITSTCVAYTHYAALLFLPIVAACSMVGRPRSVGRIALASAVLAGLATFGAWTPVFLAQRSVGTPYDGAPTLLDKAFIGFQNLLSSMPTSSLYVAVGMFGVLIAHTIFLLRARELDPAASLVGGIYGLIVGLASLAGLLETRYVTPFCGLLCVFLAYLGNDALIRLDGAPISARLVRLTGFALALALIVPNVWHAFALNQIPRSGISTLSGSGELEPDALYVIAPDYLVSTFAFYTQQRAISRLGFARRENSDVFVLEGYENVWAARDVVDRTVVEVERLAATHDRIHYIVDHYAVDRGRMRYGKVWELLHRLRDTYRLEGVSEYRGRQETIDDYRFVKRHSKKRYCLKDRTCDRGT